jgi:hypothetical protein
MTVSSEKASHMCHLGHWVSTRLTSLIFIFFATLRIAAAQPDKLFCAFEVTVVTPTGLPAAGLSVAMIRDDDKKTVSTATTASDGVVKFCDAPIVPVRIMVASTPCGLTTVGPARAEWPDTQKLLITQNLTRCEEFNPPPLCHVLLRVSDESGGPVQGARLETKASLGPGSVVSDRLGRLFLSIKRMERLEGLIVKEGFQPMPFSEECVDDAEPKIVLRQR